jgi:hypothetical protein
MGASRFFALLGAALFSCWAAAQPTVEGKKLDASPTIDGIVGVEEWTGAATFSGLVDSGSGGEAPETGEFWIGYDDQYIYFAAKLADRDPAGIVATEYRTNVSLEGNDHVHLYIDPAGTLNSVNEFWVNPNGATNLQLSGGRALKREWLGDFVAKGRVTESGWEVEARIPWQLMQLPAPGPRNLRIQVARYMARTQRTYAWTYTGGQPQRMGIWQNVSVPKSAFRRNLKLLPYVYAGRDHHGELIFNSGLDLKTSLSPTIELVGTVNPDFRNIENNVLSLDFSYFERLPADVRPFFAEGANYYGSALFNSLRISSLDMGLNSYGQVNDRISFGALATTRLGEETDFTGAFSYRQSGDTFWRGAMTSLRREGDLENDAYLLRYQKELGPWIANVRGQWTQDSQVGIGSNWDVFLQYTKAEHQVFLFYNEVTPNFLPRLGFIPEVDYKGWFADYFYIKPVAKGPIMEWGFETHLSDLKRFHGGDYRDQQMALGSVTLRNGLDVDFGYDQQTFLGFEDHLFIASIEKPRGDRYRHWQLDYREGRIAGADFKRSAASFQYRPVQALQLDLRLVRLEHFDKRTQQILTAVWDIGKDQSINARVRKEDDDTSGYIAYRRSGNRGNEYFLIFGDPNSRTFQSSVILKVTMPIQIG